MKSTDLILVESLKAMALDVGFDVFGVAPAHEPIHYDKYLKWLDKGHSADLWYLQEEKRKQKRQHPKYLLPSVQSVLVGSVNYKPKEDLKKTQAKIARYAWGRDYHKVLKKMFKQLLSRWQEEHKLEFEYKIYVDTGPILERDYAQQAGVGWIGKNTCSINQKVGSYTFLGTALVSLELPVDKPATNHCGTCTRCLDACPTQAFEGPYQLNANKCISYHTIENRDASIPKDIKSNLNGWIIGCDICQEVCPWNRKSPVHSNELFEPRSHVRLSKDEIHSLDDETFRQHFAGTSLYRTGLKKIQNTNK